MNLWDKKAQNYARYSQNLNEIQNKSFKEFQKFGIDFRDKTLIDIGCGTGVWTLHLAREAKEILALDSSKAMLEILEQDSKNLKLNNVKCVNLGFKEFIKEKPNFTCDIAFLSMSPALQDEGGFKHFLKLGKAQIYLGWEEFRKSDFLEPIFKHFKTEFKGIYQEDLESFLRKENLKFHKCVFDETRVMKRSKEEALQNALWHLQMNGFETNLKELESFIQDEMIIETIKSKIKLILIS